MVSVVRVLGVAAALAVIAPAPAQAQSAPREARQLFEQGMEHAAAERWVEALDSFRASAERYDRANTHLNIASVLLRLGRHIEARDGLRVLFARDDLTAAERQQAEALLERASEGVRVLELRVDPANASVRLDGAPIEGEGAARGIELDPGTHRIEIAADGFRSETREVPGAMRRMEATLAPIPATVRVRSSVETARIAIDGEPRGEGEVELEVAPGRHELVVTAAEHEPFERWLALSAGERLEVVASLSRLANEEPWESPWFWVVGGGAAAAVVGLAIGLAIGLAPEPQYDGGTIDDVLVPR